MSHMTAGDKIKWLCIRLILSRLSLIVIDHLLPTYEEAHPHPQVLSYLPKADLSFSSQDALPCLQERGLIMPS